VKKLSENGHSIKQLKFLSTGLPFLKNCSRIFRPNDVEAGDLFENNKSTLERCGINWFWVSVYLKKTAHRDPSGAVYRFCPSTYKHEAVNLPLVIVLYEGWNFNSGNYLFTADTK